MKTLSILVPTRNRAEYLSHTLKLCAKVATENVEFVVINNNSNDSTTDIYKISSSDKRFRIINFSKTGSICDQFTRALNAAEGAWSIIIGDDDAIIPSMIDNLARI